MKMVYVAAPYTAHTLERKLLNVEVAKHMGCLVAELGFTPLMPTVNSANMDILADVSGNEWEFWMQATSRQLISCDAIVFCQGWHNSRGCIEEHKQARDMDIPIFTDARGLTEWEASLRGET